jgi:hypothetical protein
MLDTITGSCASPASTCSRRTTQKLANRTKERPKQQLKSEKYNPGSTQPNQADELFLSDNGLLLLKRI